MVTAVCTGGEAPPASVALAWLNLCTDVIAADAGLRWLKALDRRADLWIGDGDSVGDRGALAAWYHETRLLDADKDDSDTDAAVAEALRRGADEVWLIGGGGSRMDHWLSNVRLFAARPRLTRWLTAHEEIWSLSSGGAVEPPAGLVSVFPLGEGPWKARSAGLKWPLDGVDFSRWHSLSNHAESGARVESERGRFLVLRPLQGDAR